MNHEMAPMTRACQHGRRRPDTLNETVFEELLRHAAKFTERQIRTMPLTAAQAARLAARRREVPRP
jgi:hypothetical protein